MKPEIIEQLEKEYKINLDGEWSESPSGLKLGMAARLLLSDFIKDNSILEGILRDLSLLKNIFHGELDATASPRNSP